ncbi:hypothetical protein OC846_001277 [Tilletia horrida]|uniref:Methyltransferase domain-containing protein n=1 Tax=Tilletia horrida TaxID=155126 RepID=A0AAN6JW48_9BASI|nr:hypothetical protein OC845_000752 [Tilletia horrida]KAK0556322.1 hypothetical protein OC846_001277 [Tilletia horrida]KAK0569421.1 hypothetical protein OC861_000909 [Tilletia horrida]
MLEKADSLAITPGVAIYVVSAVLATIVVMKLFNSADKKDEIYSDMNHVAFNVRPPTTAWLNMGYWSTPPDHTQFVDAAEQLATRLHQAVFPPFAPRCSEPLAILDVGCGSGDSVLLLNRTLQPQTLHGVTSIDSHASFARKRLEQASSSAGQRDLDHDVFCGDAVQFLAPGRNSTKYDAVFALDCAYHFNDRPTFFRNAFAHLKPGGSIALVDMALAWPYPTSQSVAAFEFVPSTSLDPPSRPPTRAQALWHWISCQGASTPTSHFVPIDVYASHLHQAGFGDIKIEDISEHVFPGFANFLASQGRYVTPDEAQWRVKGNPLLNFGFRVVGNNVVAKWAAGGDAGMIRCVLVSARKPEPTNGQQ